MVSSRNLVRRIDSLAELAARMTASTSGEPRDLPDELDALRRELAELQAENARLVERLAEAEALADRDALTPLLNRRALLRELERVRTFGERYQARASLAYFDVDGLKAVNDRLGHAAGDAVLKAVAERLLAHVRASDVVARMGGDEFAVILVQTDGFRAEAKAEALAQAIAETPIPDLRPSLKPAVSWGVAEIRAETSAEAIVEEADAAMYGAKRARRDAGA
jgi:diguanylate cyclase (GGDEF)-like protein